MTLATLATLALAPGEAAAAAPCDATGADPKPLMVAAQALVNGSPLPERFWKTLQAADVSEALEVDQRVQRFTIIGHKPLLPALRLPLALPAPWSGSVVLAPRPGDAGTAWCAAAQVVLIDKELRRASLTGLPVDVTVTVAKKGAPARTLTIAHDTLVLGPRTIDALRDEARDSNGERDGGTRLWIGDGPPGEDALLVDGVDTYMEFLAALGGGVVEDIRANPSRQAQRVLFAEAAASWRSDLASWLPRKRIDTIATIAKFDEKAMAPETRPLLRFWRRELTPGKIATGTGTGTGTGADRADSARLIVDDAVLALWLEGVEVFDRAKGTSTSIELKAPKTAVRAWIVTRSGAGAPVVHDTRAVLRGGEIYAVTSTFVQHARGGARRECVRVVGALPFDKDLLWREIANVPATRPGPMLRSAETYRPSLASAERAITVVPGGDTRPFPPIPLVYSYTHPGMYQWTLAKHGGVELELITDERLCPAQ